MEEPFDRDFLIGLGNERLALGRRGRRKGPLSSLDVAFGQSFHEVGQQHVVKMMLLDAELFARDVNALGRVEMGRVDAEIDVGHERAQEDHAVALFDIAADRLAAHCPFVNTQVERVPLAHDRFAQQRGTHRNLVPIGQPHHFFAQAETVDLDAGDDHRLLALLDHADRVFDGRFERLFIA